MGDIVAGLRRSWADACLGGTGDLEPVKLAGYEVPFGGGCTTLG
jgi:hypothetical protein